MTVLSSIIEKACCSVLRPMLPRSVWKESKNHITVVRERRFCSGIKSEARTKKGELTNTHQFCHLLFAKQQTKNVNFNFIIHIFIMLNWDIYTRKEYCQRVFYENFPIQYYVTLQLGHNHHHKPQLIVCKCSIRIHHNIRWEHNVHMDPCVCVRTSEAHEQHYHALVYYAEKRNNNNIRYCQSIIKCWRHFHFRPPVRAQWSSSQTPTARVCVASLMPIADAEMQQTKTTQTTTFECSSNAYEIQNPLIESKESTAVMCFRCEKSTVRTFVNQPVQANGHIHSHLHVDYTIHHILCYI